MSRTYLSESSVLFGRFPYRKSYGWVLFVVIVLVMSWESARIDAAVAGGAIPQEAIRLRILANSDSPSDQLVKRIVRDEIVQAMNGWVGDISSLEGAREAIEAKLPEIEQIVESVLRSRGFSDSYSAELGMVDFPTKQYGRQLYPAGQYEALLVTIGEGKGKNWWCVLFPPLCFMDAATGEASAPSGVGTAKASFAQTETSAAVATDGEGAAPQAKFFLAELIESLFGWLKSLF